MISSVASRETLYEKEGGEVVTVVCGDTKSLSLVTFTSRGRHDTFAVGSARFLMASLGDLLYARSRMEG